MKKGFLGIILAVAMLFSGSCMSMQTKALGMEVPSVKFDDIAAHWSKDAVEKLIKKNAIRFNENQLLPDKAIKRSEFAIMLHKALDIQIAYFKEPNIKDYYDDIEQNALYTSAVIDLVTAKILEGKGSFKPEAAMTKEELVHYVMLAYKYKMADNYVMIKIGPATFQDVDMITPEYSADVARAQHDGLIIGNGNNMFQPKKAATRAETIVVISRLVELLEKQNQQITIEPIVKVKSDSIEMKIKITNETKNDVIITNMSGQKFDFELLDADRKAVYRWSADKSFILALTTTTIEAGKTLEFSDTLSGDAYKEIKDRIVYLKAFITGKAQFINTAGYEIRIK